MDNNEISKLDRFYDDGKGLIIINKNKKLKRKHIPETQKQNSSYLADAFDTIKLNYKCPKGTVDDSNKCGNIKNKENSNNIINNIAINKLITLENPNIENTIVFKDNEIIGQYIGENDNVDISQEIKNDMFKNFGKYDVAHNHPNDLNTVLTPSGDDIKLAMERGGKNYVVTKDYIYEYSFDNKNTDINIPDKWRYWSKDAENRNLDRISSDINKKWTDISLNIKYLNKKFPENKNFATKEQRTEIAHKALKTFAKKIGMNYNRLSISLSGPDNTVRVVPEKVKEDSAYISNAFETIKLNYNCPDSEKIGSGPGSCGGSSDTKKEIFDNFKYEMDAFFKIPAQIADSKLIQYNQNISKHPENIRLEGMRLIHRTGSNNYQKEAREQIISEITNNTQLGKYLNDKIIAETKAFEENPVRLYRSGKYKNSIIESFTSNPDSAFTTNFDDVPPGNDFHKDYDELKTDGWKVLSGVLQSARYPEEYEVTLINIDELNKYRNKQKQNSAYLEDVSDFIKLNYKCKAGTVDDSNKCEPEQEKSSTSDSKHPSETFIGFKADHDFSSPQDIEANKRIQTSLDRAAEPLKQFKPEDRKILKQYSSNSYVDVNQYLNGSLEKELDQDSSILQHAKEDIAALDKLFIDANLQEPLVTYRGLKDDILVKNPELRDALDTPGSEIEFPCFSSTSALPFMANNFAEGYNGRLLELQLPTGTKALFIAEESVLPNEFEILVNRGTKFKVVETRYTDIIPPNNGSYKDKSAKHVKITTIKAIV